MTELDEILDNEPSYRLKQIKTALFDVSLNSYDEITTLSKDLRKKLSGFDWLLVKEKILSESKIDSTQKALLTLFDGAQVETVLLPQKNKKTFVDMPDEYPDDKKKFTICISSQVGCPMGCVFCATGTLGLKRNLSAREIVDQYRYWQRKIKDYGEVTNIVLMGQGEPLLNYDAVKEAISDFLIYAKIAPRKITLSTVGVRDGMEKILSDKDFPKIRFALSLHSAIDKTRQEIIPSHTPGFFDFLIDWSARYHQKFTSRNLFIGLEYLMLGGFNDDDKHLRALGKLASKVGLVRVNLISFNHTTDKFKTTEEEKLKHFQKYLNDMGIIATIRKSQGSDIDAACGQLSLKC